VASYQTLRPKSQVMLKGLGREIETHLSVLSATASRILGGVFRLRRLSWRPSSVRWLQSTSELMERCAIRGAHDRMSTPELICALPMVNAGRNVRIPSPNAHNSGSIRNRRRICARRSATLALTKSMASCGWNQTQNAKSLKKWVPPSAQLEF